MRRAPSSADDRDELASLLVIVNRGELDERLCGAPPLRNATTYPVAPPPLRGPSRQPDLDCAFGARRAHEHPIPRVAMCPSGQRYDSPSRSRTTRQSSGRSAVRRLRTPSAAPDVPSAPVASMAGCRTPPERAGSAGGRAPGRERGEQHGERAHSQPFYRSDVTTCTRRLRLCGRCYVMWTIKGAHMPRVEVLSGAPGREAETPAHGTRARGGVLANEHYADSWSSAWAGRSG